MRQNLRAVWDTAQRPCRGTFAQHPRVHGGTCISRNAHQCTCVADALHCMHANVPHSPAWGPGAEQEGRQAYAARRQEAQMQEQIDMVLDQQRASLQAGTWAARQPAREARQVPPAARL